MPRKTKQLAGHTCTVLLAVLALLRLAGSVPASGDGPGDAGQGLLRGAEPRSLAAGEAEWVAQSSGTSSVLHAVAFVDSQNGWAAGHRGTILKTTDGGTSWSPQSSGTTDYLESLAFVDAQIGWAVGAFGTILKTTDGGTTWFPQSSGTTNYLESVAFVDANTGWAVGANGTILKTIDGGANWTTQPSGTSKYFYSVAFVDGTTGWAAGVDIFKTTDGGATWALQLADARVQSLTFVDANVGWAVGEGIMKTTDGGATWARQSADTWFFRLNSVAFVNANNAWAVGRVGTILKTANGGAAWARESSGTANWLWSVAFVNAQTGWAVGDEGTILRHVEASPNYAAEYAGQSFPALILPSRQATAWIELRNTGKSTWYRDGANPLLLGTSNPLDRPSRFYTQGDWLSPSRPTALDQESVAPGQTGRFTFLLTAPSTSGVYREYFRPVAEGLTWLNSLGTYFEINVTGPLYRVAIPLVLKSHSAGW